MQTKSKTTCTWRSQINSKWHPVYTAHFTRWLLQEFQNWKKRNLTVMHNTVIDKPISGISIHFNYFTALNVNLQLLVNCAFHRYLLRTLIGDILHNLRERWSVQHHFIPHSKKRFQSSLRHAAHGKFKKSRIKWIWDKYPIVYQHALYGIIF